MVSKITQNEINKTFQSYNKKYEGHENDYFGLLYISKKFNLSIEDAASYVAFGGNDYGIDAFYFDEEKRNLFLYQFKWSDNHKLFKESFQKFKTDGLDRIFGNSLQDKTQNQVINKLRTCLEENQIVINKIFLYFVFNGDTKKAEQSKVLESLREDIEDKNYIINKFFGRDVGLIIQYISNQRTISEPVQKRFSHKYQIECLNSLKLNAQENELLVTFISLNKLLQMYNDLGERLFNKNIRSGLGEGKETNRAIKRSIKMIISGEEPAENFTFYHNGITLTTEKIEPIDNNFSLIEPRVLNGAQTIKTLKAYVDDNKTDDRIPEKLQNIKVMARVVKSSQEKFLNKVTINNNRQNPIRPWNLRANDLIQSEFEDLFKEKNIFYERRENEFENLTYDELEEKGISDYNKAIEITKFAQTLLAMQGEIYKMSKISEVFENDNFYENTFKEKYYQDVNPNKLILFYKIQYRLPSLIREILSKGEDKYNYVTKARNLLWALSIQGLLNDNDFEDYVEKYGQFLVMEGEYTGLLKDIATKKIRFIFKETFQNGKYVDYVNDKENSFLKSNSTYNDCMIEAKKLYKWEKIKI